MKVLLIEDNAGDARLLCNLLAEESRWRFSVVREDRIASGLARLGEGGFDLILLDLGLPDSEGIDTLHHVRNAVPTLPIIVLTGLNDEMVALHAVRDGAQDYLVKGQIDRQVLVRAITYARERYRLTAALQSWALIDELTGLYNRRGFVTIAAEQLKLARRLKQSAAVAFVDLDGMKGINDEFGHEAGDRALKITANILRGAFRNADVLARLGGDEFVVLAIGVDAEAVSDLCRRLELGLACYNDQEPAALPLSFSVGIARYDPAAPISVSIEELMAEADQAMYEQKQLRRANRGRQDSGLERPRKAS